MSDSHSIAEARNHLARLVHDAEKGRPVALTRRGKRVAVLLSAAEYDRMMEGKRSHWDALQAWRNSVDLESLHTEEVFQDVRDPSPGRTFNW